jgi:benzoate 4-monooxygenase
MLTSSITAIVYLLAENQAIQARLQKELDEHLGIDDDPVATHEQVKHLSYLSACINEGLRILSTSGLGLPRVVPEGMCFHYSQNMPSLMLIFNVPGGLVVCGRFFPPGSVVGVPSYTIHRDPDIWGNDPDVYRPERWFDTEKSAAMLKTFNPFSVGPRCVVSGWHYMFESQSDLSACVGRNLAMLELMLFAATLFRRYHFVLAEPGKPVRLDSLSINFSRLTFKFIDGNPGRLHPKAAPM